MWNRLKENDAKMSNDKCQRTNESRSSEMGVDEILITDIQFLISSTIF